MPTSRLVWYSIGWFLASVMIAVVTAIVGTEMLSLTPWVQTGESSYRWTLNVLFLVVLVALIAVPFVFRERFGLPQDPDSQHEETP